MPKRSRLTHRRLVLVETLLLGALLQFIGHDWLRAQGLPPIWTTLLGMAAVIGLFAGVAAIAQRTLRSGIDTTHRAARRLPLPTPWWLLHALALGALFTAYFYYWEQRLPTLNDVGATRVMVGNALGSISFR